MVSADTEAQRQRRVLIVEDEYFIANDLVSEFQRRDALIVGPVPSVSEARRVLSSRTLIDIAVLDINLRGEAGFDLADLLDEAGIPFVFVSGYERSVVPARHADVRMFQKPADPAAICDAVLSGRTAPTSATLPNEERPASRPI